MAKGIVEKLKKKILPYGLISSLFISSLFPLKSFAETVIDKTFKMDFGYPTALYEKNNRPKTDVRVKVDLDEIEENDYNLKISLYAPNWNTRQKNLSDYTLFYNPSCRILAAHSRNVSLDEPLEMVYAANRANTKDKYMDVLWEEAYPPGQDALLQIKNTASEIIIDQVVGFFPGGINVLMKTGELITINKNDGRRIFERAFKDRVKVSQIPFYPCIDSNIVAREFEIPVSIKKKGGDKQEKVLLLMDIGLQQGERKGCLENLLLEIPLEKETGINKGDQKAVIEYFLDDRSNVKETEISDISRYYSYFDDPPIKEKNKGYIWIRKDNDKFEFMSLNKIKNIEFLNRKGRSKNGLHYYEVKISLWDGSEEIFDYLEERKEEWKGKIINENFGVGTYNTKKIIFLDKKDDIKKEDIKDNEYDALSYGIGTYYSDTDGILPNSLENLMPEYFNRRIYFEWDYNPETGKIKLAE